MAGPKATEVLLDSTRLEAVSAAATAAAALYVQHTHTHTGEQRDEN